MNNTSYVSSSGISLFGLLGVVFVTLKLTHVIDWSWFYVTMPFWLLPAIGLVALIIWAIAFAALSACASKNSYR
jgi:hypothetical protein